MLNTSEQPSGAQKSAMVALVGRPNVGKSTLINALLGHKLSIVSNHPHTTRKRVLGACYQGNTQLLLCDTPGLATNLPNSMHRAMQHQLIETLQGVDMLVWMLHVQDDVERPDKAMVQLLLHHQISLPIVLAINQTDRLKDQRQLLPLLARLDAIYAPIGYAELVPISAKRKRNLDRLLELLAARASHQGWLYGKDFVTDQDDNFAIAETLREKILWQTRAEVPHQFGIHLERLEHDTHGRLRIHALISVERKGHKLIIIGQRGAALKRAASRARLELERRFGCKVVLKVWVQVKPGWQNDTARLVQSGYAS